MVSWQLERPGGQEQAFSSGCHKTLNHERVTTKMNGNDSDRNAHFNVLLVVPDTTREGPTTSTTGPAVLVVLRLVRSGTVVPGPHRRRASDSGWHAAATGTAVTGRASTASSSQFNLKFMQ